MEQSGIVSETTLIALHLWVLLLTMLSTAQQAVLTWQLRFTLVLQPPPPQPPILQINTDGNSSVLGYPTDGHYLNVSGIKTEDGVTYFQLTDPNRGRKNLTPKYDITVDKAYEFTMNHWAGHFLY